MKTFNFKLLILFLFSANLLFAQRGDDKNKLREEIDKVMKQKLMDRLSLDEFTADKFLTSAKENNKQLRMINKEKKDLMESIELDPGAADIDTKLDKMLELESRILEQRKNFYNELRTFLTPQQIAKTIILKRNFEKEFRKEILKQRKRNKDRDNEGDNN